MRTLRYPFPEKGAPGVPVAVAVAVAVGTVEVASVVEVPDGEVAPLGKYLIPVAGQVDFVPSVIPCQMDYQPWHMKGECKPGSAATNSPVCTLPATL